MDAAQSNTILNFLLGVDDRIGKYEPCLFSRLTHSYMPLANMTIQPMVMDLSLSNFILQKSLHQKIEPSVRRYFAVW